MIHFSTPAWLLLIPLPLLLWLVVNKWPVITTRFSRMQHTDVFIHSQADTLIALTQDTVTKRPVPWLWFIGCMLLFSAMARPQWLDYDTPATNNGYNIMLALDVSGSMRAQDFIIDGSLTSRMDMLRIVIKKFLEQRKNDRIGLVVFGDDAMTYSPMTTDTSLTSSFLDEITLGMAGEKTALGDAIALAVERLQQEEQKSRILILLTDGSNTSGTVSPDSAALLARHHNVRIYPIGIGTNETVSFPRGPAQKPVYTELPLDEDQLRRIAAQSNGTYFSADNQDDLHNILSEIDKLERIEITSPEQASKQEWYWLPLLAGLLLILVSERRGNTGLI